VAEWVKKMNDRVKDQFRKLSKDPRALGGGGILLFLILVAIFASVLAPTLPHEMDIMLRLQSPSWAHWLGRDVNGADVLTGMLYGARTSLYIGFATVFLSGTVGILVGLFSGYVGRWVDLVIMRVVDILMAFPGILLAMVLAAVLGPSLHNIIFAIAATGWIASARLVRGQVLSLKEREFVVASRAIGASHFRTVFRYILPPIFPLLAIHATFTLSGVILVEASLSFLGLGPQSGAPTWGALLSQGKSVLTEAPHLTLVPGFAIAITVLSLNFLGDALRDAWDPKSQKKFK
jgi:peptide/nickel transport system permease protein